MAKTLRGILDDVRADMGYAARTLLRAPGFLVAVASLGVAVGATTSVYATVDWLLNRPPTGVVEPDRLVAMSLTEAGRDGDRRARRNFSYPQYQTLTEIQNAFIDVAAYGKLTMFAGTDGWTDQLVFQFVAGSYFSLLGVRPLLGRVLGPEDDVVGAQPTVVLSHDLWQSRFGGAADVVGRPIRLQGAEGRIVGVMPRSFEDFNLDWNAPTGLWLPLSAAPALGMGVMLTSPVTFYPILGRLRPGVDRAEALERAQRWVEALPPVRSQTIDLNTIRFRDARDLRISRRDEARAFLGALLVVCALILVAACFNVANFFLGRAARRRREIALRTAMGARPSRVLRQLSTEALLLAAATALASTVIGVWIGSLLATMPNLYLDLPVRAGGITTAGAVDRRMLAMSVGAGAATAFALALLPMLAVFGNPIEAIKGSAANWSWGRIRPTPRQGLLAFQVALSVVLSVTAALYAQGFQRALAEDPEYADPPTLLFARISPVEEPRSDNTAFFDALLERIEAAPWGVSAALAYNQPYAGGYGTAAPLGAEEAGFDVDGAAAMPGLFATLGVPLVAGRDVTDEDPRDVAVINRTLAERLWPGESPIGREFSYGGDPVRVIGVVARERCADVLAPPKGCVWRTMADRLGGSTVYVRTNGPAADAMPRLRALVDELDPGMTIVEEQSLESFLEDRLRAERTAAVASSGLALFGIVLLVIGCVSLFVSMVRDSVREIAIRMALGATNGRITATVVSHGLLVTVLGTALGVVVALLVARRLAAQFHAVSATDLPTFVLVPGLILLVATAAVGYSAVTATRTDPAEHLQAE